MGTAQSNKPSQVDAETWHVQPDYGKENVFRVWDADDNFHDDVSPEAMDRRAQLMASAPRLLKTLQNISDEIGKVLNEAGHVSRQHPLAGWLREFRTQADAAVREASL